MTTMGRVELGGGGIEQKGKRLMDMDNSVVIVGKGSKKGLNGKEKYKKNENRW